MVSPTRRQLLASVGVATTGLAGCITGQLEGDSDDESQTSCTLPDDPPSAATCTDDGFKRLDQRFSDDSLQNNVLEEEGTSLFEMESQDTVALGETISITMTNVSGEDQLVGVPEKYDIQRYTADGWQNVRGYDGEDYEKYSIDATVLAPDDSYDWSLPVTADGFSDDEHGLYTCPAPEPGTYRFAYWEVGGAIATCFEVTD